MSKNKIKQRNMSKPIEEHNTAAWANIDSLQLHSRVSIPSDINVRNAKEWVDTNQK